ncbi:MAG: hypothetical protein IPP94_10150 [Ignavibacteria bacterium]|nr:hypothetical protein [Ignavibacteria bacterium]
MTTIAITTFGNRVSARLDCADCFLLVKVHDGKVLTRTSMHLDPRGGRQVLEGLGVRVLICGGLTEQCVRMLRGSRIRVIPWVQGDVEEVLTQFIALHASAGAVAGKEGTS